MNSTFYKDRKVLVTGASGLSGSHLMDALLEEGAYVRAVEHVTPIAVTGKRLTNPNLEIFRAGLCNVDNCKDAVEGIEFVFHCAAVTSGAYDIVHNPAKHITPNLIMCSRLLEAAAGANVKRFLFMSSTTVYPNSTAAMREDDVWKGDPHPSYQAVGWMKRYVEKLCEFYNDRTSMHTCIVRPANIYGPGDDFNLKAAHVLPALIHRIVRGDDPLEVWGTGYDIREFIYVDDLVRGLLLTLEKYCCGKPVNLGSGYIVSIGDAVNSILEVCKSDSSVIFDATKPSTIPIRRINSSLAKAVLGFEAKITLKSGLLNTIDWFKDNCSRKEE